MLNSRNSLVRPNDRYQIQKPIAIVNLDIGPPITIYPDDDILEVLQNFCEDNDLDTQCVDFLYQTIITQIQQKQLKISHPPSFGGVGDFLAESFGNPPQQIQDIPDKETIVKNQSEVSYQSSNQSGNQTVSEKTEQQLASDEERWQKIHDVKQKQNVEKETIRKAPSAIYEQQHNLSKLNLSKLNLSKQDSSPRRFQQLYQDGLEQYKMREEIQKLNLQQKNEEEFEKATFTPRISQKSKTLVLIKGRQNITTQRKVIVPPKPKEFTFKPQLTENTLKIAAAKNNDRSVTPPIYQKLYAEGAQTERLKQKWAKDLFDQQHPFKNKVDPKSPKLNYKQQQEGVRRLTVGLKDRNSKNDRQSVKTDSSTGQQLFQPRINKDQIYLQVSEKVDYQDKILSQRLSILNSNISSPQTPTSKAQTPSNTGTHTRNNTRNHTHTQTNNLLKTNEFDAIINKIFDLLDGDNDGLISATNLDLSKINGNVLELIADLLYHMEDDGLIFNLQKFKDMCITNGLNDSLIREYDDIQKTSGQFKSVN